jgi:hypothetical protein
LTSQASAKVDEFLDVLNQVPTRQPASGTERRQNNVLLDQPLSEG